MQKAEEGSAQKREPDRTFLFDVVFVISKSLEVELRYNFQLEMSITSFQIEFEPSNLVLGFISKTIMSEQIFK